MIKELLEIIQQTPLPEKKWRDIECPYCGSEHVEVESTSHTLVGYPGKFDDRNHYWYHCLCKSCGKNCIKERKGKNVWYTEKGRVLKGVSSCFENYIYTCKSCGGDIVRKHTKLDGRELDRIKLDEETEIVGLSTKHIDGKWVKQYRTFYYCKSCDIKIETETDY